MLRHSSTSALAGLLSGLRSNGMDIIITSQIFCCWNKSYLMSCDWYSSLCWSSFNCYVIVDSVSSTFWLVHEDLHEGKVIAALEYMSSIVATVEALTPSPYMRTSNLENSYLEHSSTKGRFHVRIKRRNGRVRVIVNSLLFAKLLVFWCETFGSPYSWCSMLSVKILLSSHRASNLHPFHLKMQSSIKALYRRLVYLDFDLFQWFT